MEGLKVDTNRKCSDKAIAAPGSPQSYGSRVSSTCSSGTMDTGEGTFVEFRFEIRERVGNATWVQLIQTNTKEGPKYTLLLENNKESVTFRCELCEIVSIHMLDNSTLRLKKVQKGSSTISRTKLSFLRDSDFEVFFEKIFEYEPRLEFLLFSKGKSLSLGKKKPKRLVTNVSLNKDLMHGEESGDIQEQQSGDEGGGNNDDDEVSFEARKQCMLDSVEGSEWVQHLATRYNRFGQAEPCSCMVSLTRDLMQIISVNTGKIVAAYELADIIGYSLHGSDPQGISLQMLTVPGAESPMEKINALRAFRTGADKPVVERKLFRPTKNDGKKMEGKREKENKEGDQIENDNKKSEHQSLGKDEPNSTETGQKTSTTTVALEGFGDGPSEEKDQNEKDQNEKPLRRMTRRLTRRPSRRAPITARPQRRSTLGGYFSRKMKGKKSQTKMAVQVTENLVFDDPSQLKDFRRLLKKRIGTSSKELKVEKLKTYEKSACIQEMSGGWSIFHGTLDTKQTNRTIALNPLIGCMFVFKPPGVKFGYIQPDADPCLAIRFCDLATIKVTHMSKHKASVCAEFRSVDTTEDDIGIPPDGSFDPILAGIRAIVENKPSIWKYRCLDFDASADPASKKTTTIVIDFLATEEAYRFMACMSSMKLVSEGLTPVTPSDTPTRPRRKSSFMKRKKHTLTEAYERPSNQAPALMSLGTAEVQRNAWSTVREKWFTSERNVFVGTFNVGDASCPKSSVLEHWIPMKTNQHSIYAIGFQEVSAKFDDWSKGIANHLGKKYRCAISIRLWEIGLLVFVHEDELAHIVHLVNGAEKTGIRIAKAVTGVQLGNKGGVGVGFRWRDVPVAFICAHLSAQQNKVAERNLNFQQIMAKLALDGSPSRLQGCEFEPTIGFEHVFFLGDVNYRVDLDFKQAENAVMHENWALLHQHDQLEKERRAGRAFFGYETELPHFAPSYRWKRNKRELSNKKGQPPSYTDRVLWHSREGAGAAIQLESYTCADKVMVSDHRPVAAVFTMQVRHEYSWPHHPFTLASGKNLIKNVKQGQVAPMAEWISSSDSLFVARKDAGRLGSAEIKLKDVTVTLFVQDDVTMLPAWTYINISSPILHDAQMSSHSPGTEVRPDLQQNTTKYAYQGVGCWSDLYYCFDNHLGFPKLSPNIWDPLYLRSQHLLVRVTTPSAKLESVLSTMHSSTTSSENDEVDVGLSDVSRSKNHGFQSGQASIPLCHVIDKITKTVATTSLSAWSRETSPCVPFSSPLIHAGVEVGRITGDISLLPPRDGYKSDPVGGPNQKIIKQGWAQLLFRSSNGCSTRVYVCLVTGARLYGFSKPPSTAKQKFFHPRHAMICIDVALNAIANSSSISFTLDSCSETETGKQVEIVFAPESKADTTSWITAFEDVRQAPAPKQRALGSVPPGDIPPPPPPPKTYQYDESIPPPPDGAPAYEVIIRQSGSFQVV